MSDDISIELTKERARAWLQYGVDKFKTVRDDIWTVDCFRCGAPVRIIVQVNEDLAIKLYSEYVSSLESILNVPGIRPLLRQHASNTMAEALKSCGLPLQGFKSTSHLKIAHSKGQDELHQTD